jgi:Ca-activated chloride channel homolog
MRGLSIKFFAVAAAILALAATGWGSGAAAARDRLVILDATNSMWGPIEGGRKYQVAREAVERAAQSLSPEARLGLYVIGNQPDAGCDALNEAMPLARLDRDALENALDGAIPDRGRMPLFPAIERAVQAMQGAEGSGRILIIGDGAGTCVPDTCTAARDLSERTGGLAIDAVALDADDETRERLQCIARETGGAYQEAGNRSEVIALVRATFSAPAPPDAPRPRPRVARPEVMPPPPSINPFRPGQSPVVTLRAVLSQGKDPIARGLAWRVLEAGASANAPEVWSGANPQPELTLPPGTYRVEVDYGVVNATREIKVRPRRAQTIDIDLNAGVLKLSGAARVGGKPVTDVFYYVNELAQGSGPGKLVARSSQPQPSFYLPAGEYRIVARHGLAEAADTVVLEAGAILGRNLALNAATLHVKAAITEGGAAPRGTLFFVHTREGDGWREVARSAQREPVFTLPEGEYRLEARLDAARARKTVTVSAGKNRAVALALPAGRLRIETQLEGQSSPIQSGVVYRMFRLDDGESRLVNTSARAQFEGFVSAGRYRVVSAYGLGNAVESQDVEIKPGETRELSFTHNAGRAQLGLVRVEGGLTLGRVNWSIRDSDGEEIYTSNETVPEPYLRVGQYVAIAQRQGKTSRRAFTVSPNQKTVVEIVAE